MYTTCKNPLFFHLVLPSHEYVSDHEKKPSVNSLGYISNLPPSVKSGQPAVSQYHFPAPQPTPRALDFTEDFSWSILL